MNAANRLKSYVFLRSFGSSHSGDAPELFGVHCVAVPAITFGALEVRRRRKGRRETTHVPVRWHCIVVFVYSERVFYNEYQ